MGKWRLDYDGGLALSIPPDATETFCSSTFYKLSLRRYVADVHIGFVRFKNALTYLDYKRIIALCEKETAQQGTTLFVGQALSDYIAAREMHIDSRLRLGAELKNQDKKLSEHFNEYRNVVDSAMSRKLRVKQMWDSFFMCAMRKSGNFSVPGSGKTSSVLGMYAYLKAKGLLRRIVVVCPKNAFGSWIDEFEICFDGIEKLQCFNIHAPEYRSRRDRKRKIQLESGNCNLFLFNFESVGGYREELSSIIDGKTLLVFDEVHKVKRIEGRYANDAVAIANNAHYIVAMTGTPIPNSYTDIYNFLHILFPDDYNEFFDFSPALLRDPAHDERLSINDKLQPFFCRTTKKQLSVPDANEDRILEVEAETTENRLLKILSMRYRGNRLALVIRVLQLESNPKMLLQKLDLNEFRYLLDDSLDAEEIDYADYSDEVKALFESCGDTTKFQRCVDLAAELAKQDKPTVIWCVFINSIDRLSKALETRGVTTRIIRGEVLLDERQQILADFRSGQFQVLLTNPHTLAESVSLHSICHDAIYFEYSYNLVHLLQSKDRIHRLGLPEGQYTQYYFLQTIYSTDDGDWSMGSAIYERLMDKEQIMLDAIDNHILEAMPTSDEDLEKIFAKLFN
jgi:superfamily II DNA or RNA helicase